MHRDLRRSGRAVVAAILTAGAVGVFATSAAAAPPQNTAVPTITASTGTWSGSPTTYAYQWQRCASDGKGCGDITGAADKTYTLVSGDVSHTLRVVVTATNGDGKASSSSDATDVVASKNGPTNTVKPVVTGQALVGEQLTVSNGTWSPAPTSLVRQWQRCDSDGTGCSNIDGATGRTYGVRSADVGHRLRALVTARTSGGSAAAATGVTAVAQSQTTTVTTTTTNTTTVAANKAPVVRFMSLRRIGIRVYARFRVCDDRTGRINVVARDNKTRALSYQHRFAVALAGACGTYSRTWVPAARFRGHGRYAVTLRAVDTSGRLSRLVSRSLIA
jgi:hypothetical protein